VAKHLTPDGYKKILFQTQVPRCDDGGEDAASLKPPIAAEGNVLSKA